MRADDGKPAGKLRCFFRNRKKEIVFWALIGIFGAVFLVSGFMVARHFWEAKKSADTYTRLSQMVEESAEPPAEEEEPEQTEAGRKYAAILAENDDLVGWIRIDDTRIDYPVMQTPENPNYYLRRGFDRKYSYYGVPYAAENCDVDTSSNVVIYGHNMDNGSMFSDLTRYCSESFYQEHKTIVFDTLEQLGTYEVMAVFKTVSGAEDGFAYHLFADGTAEEFEKYVAQCKSLALYDTGVTAEYGDRLITLSTCEYSRTDGRLVVVAKRIES